MKNLAVGIATFIFVVLVLVTIHLSTQTSAKSTPTTNPTISAQTDVLLNCKLGRAC